MTLHDCWRKRRLASPTLRRVALAAMVGGLGLRLRARYILGRQFSYALRTLPDHQLVTSDLYSVVRHPAYTGNLMFHFGVTIFFGSVRGLLIMLLLIPSIIYRTNVEETMLLRRFGKHYQAYQQRTKKLLPGVY
ncbi:MAG: isoprenylcysteine carboxylmethyltransferase family protein [Anaerolineae bacterium]